MLVKCSHATLFWSEFLDWWSKTTNENIHLTDAALLYGPVNSFKHHQSLSLALLVAKYFIYKCNLVEDSLNFSLFKLQFREIIMTERYIAIKNKTVKPLNDKWLCFNAKNFIPAIFAATNVSEI